MLVALAVNILSAGPGGAGILAGARNTARARDDLAPMELLFLTFLLPAGPTGEELVALTEPAALAEPLALAEPADDLPLVYGGFAAPAAWLALWRGDAWVCWDAGAEHCWQRLDVAGVVDLGVLRAEFVDRSTLVLADRSESAWLIVRGDPGPRLARWATSPRELPRTRACGPAGVLPAAARDALVFVERPCGETPDDALLCVRPARALELRRASALRLRLGVELRALDDWRGLIGTTAAATGLQILAVVNLGLDPGAWTAQRRERADLQAQVRPSLRALPSPRSRGPLRDAEREALRAAVCGGAP